MATKSILKDVWINDKKLARTLLDALSNPQGVKFRPAGLSRKCKKIKGSSVKEFFETK